MHFDITIATTNERFSCAAGQTLLSAMERLGRRDIRVGCRNGGCGVCKVRVRQGAYVTGKMSRAVLSDEERSNGFTLACKTYPDSAMVVEVIGPAASEARALAAIRFDLTLARTRRQPDKET